MNLKTLQIFIDWSRFLQNQSLLQKLIEASKNDNLKWQIIEEINAFIDWNELSKNSDILDDRFMHNFSHRLNLGIILKNKQLSIDFIRMHPNALSKHYDKISKFQKLSESAIEEFMDLLDLDLISRYQTLSDAFIVKHRLLLNYDKLKVNPNVSSSVLSEIRPSDE